jgi:NAD(P)-dependent dehydrogenase (short-subunit alcohol dehydrogenase family)
MPYVKDAYARYQRAIMMSEMKGKVCIVTGSNSGIGKETALALASMGASVVMVVRNQERGEKARAEIVDKTGSDTTALMICDLSSMNSVRQFAIEFKDQHDRLDVLINNAGALVGKRQNAVDGFETTLAVNYLGPFLLTHELLPLLKSSAPSRVINVGSGMHRTGKIDFDDLKSDNSYNAMSAYANSKLMMTTYTYELARRLRGTGVTVNVVEPGFVATKLGRNSGSLLYSLGFSLMRPFQVSAKKGAETSVCLASAREVEGVTGKCFSKLRETTTARISYDRQSQRLLWDATVRLLELDESTCSLERT